MRAWAKRMIWFFGLSMLEILDNFTYFIVKGEPFEYTINVALIMLGIYIIPLIVMKDDKEVKKR